MSKRLTNERIEAIAEQILNDLKGLPIGIKEIVIFAIHQALAESDAWVSVDTPPETGEEIIFQTYENTYFGWFDDHNVGKKEFYLHGFHTLVNDVVRWMPKPPLPQPPVEGE